jgi:hypothetical protein
MPLYAPFNGGTIGTPILAPQNAIPSYSFSGAASTGLNLTSGEMNLVLVGVSSLALVGSGSGIRLASAGLVGWRDSTADAGTTDLILKRSAAATLQMGNSDVNGAAVAQTLQVQSAITGTDQNGANWTFKGSKQTGAGTPGDIIFQTSVKLSTGTTQGTPQTGSTITGALASQKPSVVIGNAALAADATEGFLYIPTVPNTPTGVPTTRTGRVALVFETTNNLGTPAVAGAKTLSQIQTEVLTAISAHPSTPPNDSVS